MMRYMIYDCNAQRVPLQKEIEYLQNYIELNQLKSHRKLNLKLEVAGDMHDLKIAPLLLINFVENGIKHGDINVNDRGFITIRLTIDQAKVTFEMKNSYRELHHGKPLHKGIGIENVKHRLALLYPHKHRLRIDKTENVFTVELVLEADN
jgi:LytS/YehU family sensor histidine kinase